MSTPASVPPFNPAEIYERFMVPAVFAPWARELLRRADLTPGERVLDLGCGTGIVARLTAAISGELGAVTGLDINPGMLAVARAQPAVEGAAPIEWLQGSVESIPAPDASFDLVTCQQVLQFLPDRAAALREAHRVLAPGGRVAIAVFASAELHPMHMAFDEVIAKHIGMSALRTGFTLSDPDEIRGLLEGAGFAVRSLELVSVESSFSLDEAAARNFVFSASAGIPSFRALGVAERDDVVARIAAEIHPILEANAVEGVAIVPWHAHIAIAIRNM